MRLNKKFLAGITSAALLAGAPSAYAVTSAQSAYSKPGGIVETQLDNGGGGNQPGAATQNTVVSTPEKAPQAKSSLPFTGLDLVLVVGAGGILIGLGFAMRRLSRPSGLA
jgi:hypothetical protein